MNEILSSAGKERAVESPVSPQDGKSVKGKCLPDFVLVSDVCLTWCRLTSGPPFSAPSVQQRSQIEELRKFGKEFRVRIISLLSVVVLLAFTEHVSWMYPECILNVCWMYARAQLIHLFLNVISQSQCKKNILGLVKNSVPVVVSLF